MFDGDEKAKGGALAGLLVVSIEQAVAAPLCTVRLADAGARVIKIERPAGETARHYDLTVDGMSAYFVWRNRGKESAALDLKAEEDLALLTAPHHATPPTKRGFEILGRGSLGSIAPNRPLCPSYALTSDSAGVRPIGVRACG